MKAFVCVGVHPTEDPGKVSEAVENLFPGTILEGNGLLQGEVYDLRKFRELIQKRKIRSSLEAVLEKNHCAGSTYLMFDKQAALAGSPNVYSGQEMGAIKLEFKCGENQIHEAIWGNENE